MIGIELFIDYFSYYLSLLDCFSKIIFRIIEVVPSLPIDWSLPQMSGFMKGSDCSLDRSSTDFHRGGSIQSYCHYTPVLFN